jgi:hypothetical protein
MLLFFRTGNESRRSAQLFICHFSPSGILAPTPKLSICAFHGEGMDISRKASVQIHMARFARLYILVASGL